MAERLGELHHVSSVFFAHFNPKLQAAILPIQTAATFAHIRDLLILRQNRAAGLIAWVTMQGSCLHRSSRNGWTTNSAAFHQFISASDLMVSSWLRNLVELSALKDNERVNRQARRAAAACVSAGLRAVRGEVGANHLEHPHQPCRGDGGHCHCSHQRRCAQRCCPRKLGAERRRFCFVFRSNPDYRNQLGCPPWHAAECRLRLEHPELFSSARRASISVCRLPVSSPARPAEVLSP